MNTKCVKPADASSRVRSLMTASPPEAGTEMAMDVWGEAPRLFIFFATADRRQGVPSIEMEPDELITM